MAFSVEPKLAFSTGPAVAISPGPEHREVFRAFPAVLQHQILLRFGLALGAAAAFGLFWLLSRQFWFGAPFAMLALWMGLSGVQMFCTVYRGKYTVSVK